MRGAVVIPLGIRAMRAVLEDDGLWTCPDDTLARYFNARFPLEEVSEADGFAGARQLREAAAAVGGAVELPGGDR